MLSISGPCHQLSGGWFDSSSDETAHLLDWCRPLAPPQKTLRVENELDLHLADPIEPMPNDSCLEWWKAH